jgi:excisionase family DNA binding protein
MTNLYEDDDLLTPAQVARLFNVDPKTITRWTQDGKIAAALRTLGGHRRYRYSDVRAAMDNARNR